MRAVWYIQKMQAQIGTEHPMHHLWTITPNGTRITITHDAIITESPGASSITPRFRPLASQPSAIPKLLDALHPADNSHYVSHHRNSSRSLLALNLPEPNRRSKISLARRLTLMSKCPTLLLLLLFTPPPPPPTLLALTLLSHPMLHSLL